ncbi:MAG: AMP-binding protein [Acidimicrobiia bacterium]
MRHPWDQRLGLWSIAEAHPEQPAVVECPSGVTLTFAALAGRAHQLVHTLRAQGIERGDIVAYALPNDVDPLVWQLAAQEGGIQAIALNPALSAGEIDTIVEHSGASVLAVHEQLREHVGALEASGRVRVRVSVGGPIDGFMPYDELTGGARSTLPDDRSWGMPIFYSSGTTGKPKAIVRPVSVDADPLVMADQSKLFGRAFQFQPLEGVHLVSAGMSHGGCQSFYLGALNVGQAVAIMGRFDPEVALATIERHRVTTAYMVPTQFVRLLRLPPEVRDRYDVSSLQVVVHSAAPCPVEVKQQMLDWWGPVIWETYGGMEGAATIAKPHRWRERPGTVGRAIAGMRVKILADDGRELPPGETGNVFLEPDAPTFEYREDPELTASVRRGRAFTLGDIGYRDDDGYLFLRDRATDIIISGGVNIYPAEIEHVLATHPLVGDVAVIGIPDREWGEQVKAVVELVDGPTPSPELADELVAHCRQHLAGYKCPRSIDFCAELPRTDGGKLYKRLLRDESWAATRRQV